MGSSFWGFLGLVVFEYFWLFFVVFGGVVGNDAQFVWFLFGFACSVCAIFKCA